MAQIIKIKGSKTNANATPSSLVERELASNLVDRCLFGSDGTSVFKYYTGSTKYFDANGYANNANKLGGQTIDYFASADGVADALDEIIDSLKGYQPLITSTNKLAYSLISGVPTKLSQFTDDVVSGKYLSLSGGTINGTNDAPLTINTTLSTSSIYFQRSGSYKAQIGWDNGLGAFLTNSSKGYAICIRDDGTPAFFNSKYNTLIHSGNIGSQSVANASKLGGKSATEYYQTYGSLPTNKDLATLQAGAYWVYENLGLSSQAKSTYSSLCVLGNAYYSAQLNVVHDASRAWLRGVYDSNSVSDWHELAFTDSNVASATKLQTARTIWGQSFDGTADVSGTAMGLGGAIDFQFTDEINRYGGNLYLQNRGDGSRTGTGSGATGNVVMCNHGGNVLIGTSTDNGYKLDINGTLRARGAVTFDSTLSVASTSTLMGNVGIGVAADNNKLCVHGVIRSTAYSAIGNNNAAFVFDKPSSYFTGIGANGVADTIYFGACNTLGAWVTDYYQKWHFNGEIYAKIGIWSDGYVSAKGQNTSSDMRLKNVLNDVVLNVSDIANAPSIRFAWKNGGGVDVGSSAQYWQGLLPDAVKERDGMLEMQYANIALLSAIALAKNFETMDERVARLEKENKELRNEINSLRYGA